MKLLIIGGTGVLSTAVVKEALRCSIEVTMMNRGNRKDKIPKDVIFLETDVRDENSVRKLLTNKYFDAVIDFICYNKSHVEYSFRVFKDFAKQYVFISTTCVYNTSIYGLKDEESDKVLSSWDYSINKWECESFLSENAQKDNVPFTIVRPCVTYDDTRIPYGIMPPYGYHGTIIKRILNNKPIITWDGGNAKWNLMRVEDFAQGLVPLIGNVNAYNQVYNVSGDKAYSWMDVLNMIGRILNKEVITYDISSKDYMRFFPERAGEISARALDAQISNEKIKTIIPDFKTKIDLMSGITMTINSYMSLNYQKGFDYRFDAIQDYIIAKSISKNKNKKVNFNINYIPYSVENKLTNKFIYYAEYHRNNILVKIFNLTKKMAKHIMNYIK